MDAEVRDLERRMSADPSDGGAVRELVQRHARRSAWREAQDACGRALEAGTPGAEIVDALRAAKVVLRAVPQGDRQALVALIGGSARHVAELPFNPAARVLVAGRVVVGLAEMPERARLREEKTARLRAKLAARRGGRPPTMADDINLSYALDAAGLGDPGSTGGAVLVVDLAPGLPSVAGYPVALPEGLTGHCLARVQDTLYVGGARSDGRGTELVVVRPLDSANAPWEAMSLPPEATGVGKAVDALLRVGRDRLIAVDDIILPKFNFVLDVSRPLAPRVLEQRPLEVHSTYERVSAAACGGSWFALLSHGHGRAGACSFVALHDAASLEERACISHGPSLESGARWEDLLVAEDWLAVAAGPRGVLVLDLRGRLTPSLEPGALRPSALTEAHLAPGEAVVRLTALQGSALLATIARGGVPARHALVRLPERG